MISAFPRTILTCFGRSFAYISSARLSSFPQLLKRLAAHIAEIPVLAGGGAGQICAPDKETSVLEN